MASWSSTISWARMEDREVVGFFEVLVSEPQDVDGQEKTPKLFALRRFGLRVPVAYTGES